jgi:hypothetical protein
MFSRGFKIALLVFSAVLATVSIVLAVINFGERDWNNFTLNIITLVVNVGLVFFWRYELTNES